MVDDGSHMRHEVYTLYNPSPDPALREKFPRIRVVPQQHDEAGINAPSLSGTDNANDLHRLAPMQVATISGNLCRF